MKDPQIIDMIDRHFNEVCNSTEEEMISRREEWTLALQTLLTYIPDDVQTQIVTWDSGEKLYKIGIQVIER
jgi:hypothetical protein